RSVLSLFFQCYAARRDLHSFPTRRSSDLVDLQLQGDELTRLEEEQHRLVGHEAEGAHVPGFLDHLDATHQMAAIGPSLSGNRIEDRKSTRLNSSHVKISYAVFCLKKKI